MSFEIEIKREIEYVEWTLKVDYKEKFEEFADNLMNIFNNDPMNLKTECEGLIHLLEDIMDECSRLDELNKLWKRIEDKEE